MVYPALLPILPLMRTPRLPVVDWTDAPADLNGLVRFAERPNLVSARVPSRFKRALHYLVLYYVYNHIVMLPFKFASVFSVFLFTLQHIPALFPRLPLCSVGRRVQHWSPHWHTERLLLSAAWCRAVCLADSTAQTLNKRRLQKDVG